MKSQGKKVYFCQFLQGDMTKKRLFRVFTKNQSKFQNIASVMVEIEILNDFYVLT